LGWGADVTYHFANTGHDLTWTYTHLSTNNSNSGAETSARVTSDYNAADFLFGQVIALGDRFSVHPFVGLRYAGIDYKTRVQNNNVYATGAIEALVMVR